MGGTRRCCPGGVGRYESARTPCVPAGPLPLFPVPSPLPGNASFLGRVEVARRGGGAGGVHLSLTARLQGEGRGDGGRQCQWRLLLTLGAPCPLPCDIGCILCPQPRSDSLGSSSDKTQPSVTEAEAGAEPGGGPRPRRPILLPNLSPARPRGSLVSLLGEELPPFSALVSSPSLSPAPSPALAGRGHSPSPHGPPRGSAAWKPPQLLIPPLGTFGPPDLSPR